MDALPFHFFVPMSLVLTLLGMSLLHLWAMLQVESFLCCIFMKVFAIGFQNSFSFDHEWFDSGVFLSECATLRLRYYCKD